MARHSGERLFTFAVLSDSHVNAEEDRSTSPYASNRLANARLRRVVAEIDRLRPAFAAHLGDMGNPLPELGSYAAAAERFKALTRPLRCPLHLVAGNHCVGDKPGGWVPVPRVSDDSLELFERLYGRSFYSFDHGPCHFTVVNSLLINSELAAAERQRRWLEGDLAAAGGEGKRLWLLMHYPAYVAAADEPGSYDNLDEPGRSWLLGLLERHRIEAACSGHVHHYFYNRYARTDLYTLPATSFVRQDYGELFRLEPGDEEGGRDDRAKLGYCLVDVHERGHVNRLVRTWGRTLAPGDVLETGLPESPAAAPEGALGVEIRENWLVAAALHTNNSVSPFTRRWARNDWALPALSEAGVRRLRLALPELVDEDVLERMETLSALGFAFTVYSHGMPGERELRLVRRNRSLLAGWELILGLDGIEAAAAGLADPAAGLGGDAALPCYLSEVRDISRGQIDDANVKHEANYGFQVHERERIARLCASPPIRRAFRGLSFRIRRRGEPRTSVWSAIREIGRLGGAAGMRHQAQVLFSGNLTAERLVDDLATANRVAEAALAAAATGDVDVCLDTFEDVDRGYFVRHGLVDRRYNPRLAATVLSRLQAALAGRDLSGPGGDGEDELPGGRILTLWGEDRYLALLLPAPRLTVTELKAPPAGAIGGLRRLDLADGSITELPARRRGDALALAAPLEVDRPQLVTA